MSNGLGVEAHFEALFPSSLELFPPSQLALNVQSCGSGLENSAGIQSGGVDHMLADMDISYFDKVKSSMQETCKRADFSNTSDKNPSQECKFWVVDGNLAPQLMYTSKAPPGHHSVLVRDSTGAALMEVKPLPHWELYKCNLTPMPPIPPMLLVSEPQPHKAEQLLRAVLGDTGVCFCKPAQTIVVPHLFSLSAMFSQMTALLQDSE